MLLGLSVTKNSFVLAVFALCTAGILAGTFQITYARIEEAKRHAAEKALLELVPRSRHNNDMLSDAIDIAESELIALGLKEKASLHIARMNDKIVAYVYPSRAPDGYSGDIDLIIGINADGSLSGVRVLAHKETPGLGDKVDLKKSRWILSFNNKSLVAPTVDKWKVKKDGGEFDQFTGATITPRAVIKRVKQTLEFHQQKMKIAENKNQILKHAPGLQSKPKLKSKPNLSQEPINE